MPSVLVLKGTIRKSPYQASFAALFWSIKGNANTACIWQHLLRFPSLVCTRFSFFFYSWKDTDFCCCCSFLFHKLQEASRADYLSVRKTFDDEQQKQGDSGDGQNERGGGPRRHAVATTNTITIAALTARRQPATSTTPWGIKMLKARGEPLTNLINQSAREEERSALTRMPWLSLPLCLFWHMGDDGFPGLLIRTNPREGFGLLHTTLQAGISC